MEVVYDQRPLSLNWLYPIVYRRSRCNGDANEAAIGSPSECRNTASDKIHE